MGIMLENVMESYNELRRRTSEMQHKKQTCAMKANAPAKHDVAISTDWKGGLRETLLLCADVHTPRA